MALSSLTGRRSNIFDPFSLEIWDPFEGNFPMFPTAPQQRETAAIGTARVDWRETQDSHVFTVDLPGLKKEEVKVEVEEGRILQITGDRKIEHDEKNDKWHRIERSTGKFLRRFRLPENAEMDRVKATMESGVLQINVPKQEPKKHEVKCIEIGGSSSEGTTGTSSLHKF